MSHELVGSLRVDRAVGEAFEGLALVSAEGFSPRYDLDRWTGLISKPGHKLEGRSIVDRVCFFPTAKGGIAAGWAFHDQKAKGLAPRALIFGVTNPVMVQGAVFAGITLTEGWDRDPQEFVRNDDLVRFDPATLRLDIYRPIEKPL